MESACGNNIDDDCDGLVDCVDFDCCHNVACSASDTDLDGYSAVCDCNNNDATVYPGAPQLCDGKNNNCSDPSWPTLPANEADADGDGHRVCAGDCDDSNSQAWGLPGEATGIGMTYDIATGATTLTWSPPGVPGGAAVHYDTLRSDNPADFVRLAGRGLHRDGRRRHRDRGRRSPRRPA